MSENVLTIREVADLLKINEKTVYKLAADAKIPGFKVGGSWRFDRSVISKWIKKGTIADASSAAGAARTERLGALKLVGVASGLAGLCVILNPASLDWSNLHVIAGAGMIILAAICWAANIIYIRSHRWIATPLQLLLWQVLVATLVLTTTALVTEGVPTVTWSPHLVLLFLYSGFIGTALAYWAMSVVNKSLPALTTSLGTTGTPIVGIVTAALLLGEPIDLSLAIAAALIVGGIALSSLADAPARA